MGDQTFKKGFRLGDWRVHPMEGKLYGPSGLQHLEPKVMKLLLCLAGHYGEVVDRETLIREVWDGRVISDQALFRCVAELRKRLGDSSGEPRYVQTVHKIGYRLVAQVESLTEHASPTVVSADVASNDFSVAHWHHPREFDGLKIIRLIGSGLMAHVHLAREASLERLVAIKTLRPDVNKDDNARRRFAREAKAAARLVHPHVTTIFRVGVLADATPYLVLQFIDGSNLAETLEIEGAFEVERGIDALRELASALAAAHDKRIIHRDIKPGNILVNKDGGHLYLSDFGIAGIQETGRSDDSRLTLAGEVLGDPCYISPEQSRGEAVTAKCDIYSFGLVAFLMISGRYAYDQTAPFDPVHAHLHDTPLSLHQLQPDLPADIARLIQRCLDKDPRRRPSAEQLVRLLDGGHEEDTATPAGIPQGSRWPLVGAIATIGVIVGLILWFLLG